MPQHQSGTQAYGQRLHPPERKHGGDLPMLEKLVKPSKFELTLSSGTQLLHGLPNTTQTVRLPLDMPKASQTGAIHS